MARERSIVKTEKDYSVKVPEDVAAELLEDYTALADLPNTRQIQSDFDTVEAARLFARQGRAWAADNGLTFNRRGDIKGNPTRVTYRIYAAKADGE